MSLKSYIMNFSKLIFLLVVVANFASCNINGQSAKKLNPEEFEQGIKTPGAQLVDVRTPEEYAEKHIANSININIDGENFERKINGLDKSKPLYLCCLTGARSGKAGKFAAKNGFKEVYNLEGGITAWIGAKKPVETSGGEVPKTGMTFDDYLAHIRQDKLVLVDFNATWCGPCKILKPAVVKVVKENAGKVELFDIDVDKNPSVASTMNVTGIPLLILYRSGKELWRNLGLTDEETIADKVKQFSGSPGH
jgi:thioredoxin 1